MASIIKVDQLSEKTQGSGITLSHSLKNSSGSEIISSSGSIGSAVDFANIANDAISGDKIHGGTISGSELDSSVSFPSFVGMVASFAMSSAPAGWIVCDGSEYLITEFQNLYDAITTNWNTAINPTTGSAHASPSAGNFRVPDFRGIFLRGIGTANGKDATSLAGYQTEKTNRPSTDFTGSMSGSAVTGGSNVRTALSLQPDGGGDLGNGWPGHVHRRGNVSNGNYVSWYPGAGHTHNFSISTSGSITGGGDNETRPINIGVLYCIKY